MKTLTISANECKKMAIETNLTFVGNNNYMSFSFNKIFYTLDSSIYLIGNNRDFKIANINN